MYTLGCLFVTFWYYQIRPSVWVYGYVALYHIVWLGMLIIKCRSVVCLQLSTPLAFMRFPFPSWLVYLVYCLFHDAFRHLLSFLTQTFVQPWKWVFINFCRLWIFQNWGIFILILDPVISPLSSLDDTRLDSILETIRVPEKGDAHEAPQKTHETQFHRTNRKSAGSSATSFCK